MEMVPVEIIAKHNKNGSQEPILMIWEGKTYTVKTISIARKEWSGCDGLCYSIEINGQNRNLFLELQAGGRWILQKREKPKPLEVVPGSGHCCADVNMSKSSPR